MSIININVTDKTLTITNHPLIVTGQKRLDKVKFEFSSEWDNFSRCAVFMNSKGESFTGSVESDNTCVIPWEFTKEAGTIYIGAFGVRMVDEVITNEDSEPVTVKQEIVITTEAVGYNVEQGVISEASPMIEPTNDVLADIKDLLTQSGKEIYYISDTEIDNIISAVEEA